MDSIKIFERIDQLQDEYINFWMDVCNIESPTEFKDGVDRVGNYIMEKAKEKGWHIKVQPQKISGDCVCITMNPEADGAPVCVSGHTDTVHPIGNFGETPVTVDNEKIYGPGVTDCKGGIVAGFLAMAALQECGFNSRPVKLILQSDEENSSFTSNKTTIDFMLECAKGSAAFLNCEPNIKDTAVLQRKGISKYSFEVCGKAAHAGNCHLGISAVTEASHKIIELEKLKDIDGITCNCGLISGGTAINTVPSQCTFDVDFRFVNNKQRDEIDKITKDIAEHSYINGTTCTVKLLSCRPAMELTDTNKQLLNEINDIFEQNGLPIHKARFTTGGSDAAYITQLGIPCIDSVGVMGGNIHTIEEYAYISSLAEAAKRIAAICCCIK